MQRSEAANLGFGLGALELVGGCSRLLGCAEHGAEPPGDLGQAQDRFRGDISICLRPRSSVSPPPPYVQSLEVGNPSPLAYGFDEPLLQGLFAVEIVG